MLKKLNDAVLNIKQKKQDTATLEYLTRFKCPRKTRDKERERVF